MNNLFELRSIREQLPLTTSEISAALNVPVLMWERWESGLIPIPEEELDKARTLAAAREPTSPRTGSESDIRAWSQETLEQQAARLYRIREALDLTQDGMSKALGVTSYTWFRWENGKRTITQHYAEKLADFAAAHGIERKS